MQIKVIDTKMHETSSFDVTSQSFKVPVVEGKPVLIANYEMTDLPAVELFGNNDQTDLRLGSVKDHLTILKLGFINYKLIIISETEKIEVGDWQYDKLAKTIEQRTPGSYNESHYAKVLVLPKQLSPKHLHERAYGKMKDNDKVLVECEQLGQYGNVLLAKSPLSNESNSDMSIYKNFVKLNSQGHVTLHKNEEKMYTKEEVKDLFIKMALSPGYEGNITYVLNWFEQNVK